MGTTARLIALYLLEMDKPAEKNVTYSQPRRLVVLNKINKKIVSVEKKVTYVSLCAKWPLCVISLTESNNKALVPETKILQPMRLGMKYASTIVKPARIAESTRAAINTSLSVWPSARRIFPSPSMA